MKGVVTASSHVLCRVLSNIVIWLLGHFWLDTPHINTFEGGSVLSTFVVCSPPSRPASVKATPAETRIMSTEALLSKTVSVKIYTKRTWNLRSAWATGSRGTKQLETVETRVIAATGSFYSARGIGSQASVGAPGGSAKKRRANEQEQR